MINITAGEFKLDDYNLRIHPELSLLNFKMGDIPVEWETTNAVTGFSTFGFKGTIEGLKAEFIIYFKGDHLHELSFEQEEQPKLWKKLDDEGRAARKQGPDAEMAARRKWGGVMRDAVLLQKSQNDAWLLKVIGEPPPYIYPWGAIFSLFDPKQDGDAVIKVEFKYSFLDSGFPDFNSLYEARKRELEGIRKQAE